MRKRTLLFVCARCSGEVFRAGKKVDQKNKLCGNCRGKGKEFSKRGVKHLKNTPETVLPFPQDKTFLGNKGKTRGQISNLVETVDNTQQIVGEICKYHNILSRVIEKVLVLKPGHTETFLGLYLESKKELGI